MPHAAWERRRQDRWFADGRQEASAAPYSLSMEFHPMMERSEKRTERAGTACIAAECRRLIIALPGTTQSDERQRCANSMMFGAHAGLQAIDRAAIRAYGFAVGGEIQEHPRKRRPERHFGVRAIG